MNYPCRPHFRSTGFDRSSNRVRSSVAALAFLPLSAFAQEAAEDIRDAKDLIHIPEPPNYALWVTGILIGIILVTLIYLVLKKRSPSREITPSERALSGLEQARTLINHDSAEPFADAVAQVIRVYIDERFGVSAPRRTTEEFLRQLDPNKTPGLSPYSGELGQFLRFCDAIKFGGRHIDAGTRSQLLGSAKEFVEVTSIQVPESTTQLPAISVSTPVTTA